MAGVSQSVTEEKCESESHTSSIYLLLKAVLEPGVHQPLIHGDCSPSTHGSKHLSPAPGPWATSIAIYLITDIPPTFEEPHWQSGTSVLHHAPPTSVWCLVPARLVAFLAFLFLNPKCFPFCFGVDAL
ncbi:predicted protein [Histoplasma capsulatum H143]|uniref:Uncharacterized protein n=1 Tax=Ajellomyces capsulatus (strain H143) TaxID=544712 RepID=C6HH88_AJECH|nr:predicted protein [Histoplasma capsulatum H143]